MCVVQRYALIGVALFTGLAALSRGPALRRTGAVVALLFSVGVGAYNGGAAELAAVVSAGGRHLRARHLRNDRDLPAAARACR